MVDDKKFNIFLTGATGFVGRHILYELLQLFITQQAETKIYLLIRKKKSRNAVDRILDILDYEFLPEFLKLFSLEQLMSYLHIIECDLSNFNLEKYWENIIEKDKKLYVIHSAGCVNLFNNKNAEQEIYETNYLATQAIFKSFCKFNTKFIFISTAFSCGTVEGHIGNSFLEMPLTEYRNPYEAYKAKIERELVKYCESQGWEWQILRPSVICGRLLHAPLYFTSKFDVFYGWGKFFWNLKKQSMNDFNDRIRIYVNLKGGLNIVPVDYLAKVISKAFTTNIKEMNIVGFRTVLHTDYLGSILKTLDFTNYEFVNEINGEMNKTERFYYKAIDSAFGPYLTCPYQFFDTDLQKKVLPDITDLDVEGSICDLISFAIHNKFESTSFVPSHLSMLH